MFRHQVVILGEFENKGIKAKHVSPGQWFPIWGTNQDI